MGALPKPKVAGAGAPVREFFEALHALHHRAGWPSLRDMAGEVGCSHTTVSVAFAGPAVPRWGLVELIVEALHGDVAAFHELWLAASSAAAAGSGTDTGAGAAAAAVRPVPEPVEASLVPRQLPGDVGAFTGRAGQLADLDRVLAESAGDPTAVVISAVSGTAGVGKTGLAVHWAHRVAGAFPDGQLYVNLRGYDPEGPLPPAEALEVFLRALGVPGSAIPHGQAERAARYRTVLADRKVLVLLDNALNVGQVRDLLPGTPSCLVLVTSRDTLPALVARYGAVRVNLDVLSSEESVALLRRLVGARVDAEPGAAAALADRCARLPLAIRIAAELAAARPSVALSRLVEELGDESRRLDLLAAGGDEHTAVRAVFSWSCRYLSDAEAGAFHLLGTHPGKDFDVEATAALVGVGRAEAYRLLDALSRAHLVEEGAVPGRFGMHDLLRAYAAEQAAVRPDRQEALLRLFDHYLGKACDDPDPGWLTVERSNLLAVASAAAEVSPEHAVGLSACLEHHLDARAHYRDALALHELAVVAAGRRNDPTGQAHALGRLGMALMRVGSYPEAVDRYRRALALHEEHGDRAGEGAARHGLGSLAWRLGHYDEAQKHLVEALAIRRELGDRAALGAALYALGTVFRQRGEYREALDHQRQALAIYREEGNRLGESRVLNNIGATFERMGRCAEAVVHLEAALALNREIGNRLGEAVVLANLGRAVARLGRFADAIGYHELAQPIYREIGSPAGEADVLHGLGDVYRRTGRHAEAVEHLSRAVALAHEVGEADVRTAALVDLGETHRAAGDHGAATEAYRSALELALSSGDRYESARASAGLAHVRRAAGDVEEARRLWLAAWTSYDALGLPQAAEVRELLAALA